MEEDTLLVCRKSKENPRKSAIRLIRFLTSYTTIDEAHFLHLMLQLYRTFSVLTAPVGHLIFGRVSFWFLHKEKHLNSVEESLFPLLENLQSYFAFFFVCCTRDSFTTNFQLKCFRIRQQRIYVSASLFYRVRFQDGVHTRLHKLLGYIII